MVFIGFCISFSNNNHILLILDRVYQCIIARSVKSIIFQVALNDMRLLIDDCVNENLVLGAPVGRLVIINLYSARFFWSYRQLLVKTSVYIDTAPLWNRLSIIHVVVPFDDGSLRLSHIQAVFKYVITVWRFVE